MMSLPAGAFITSLGGKRCTAIPRTTTAAKAPPPNSAVDISSVDPTPISTPSPLASSSIAPDPSPTAIVAAPPAASSSSATPFESAASKSVVAVAAAVNPASTPPVSTAVKAPTSIPKSTSTSFPPILETAQATATSSQSLPTPVLPTSQTTQSVPTTAPSPTTLSSETSSTAPSASLESDLSISSASLSLTSSSITVEFPTGSLSSPTKAAGQSPAEPSVTAAAATSTPRPSSNTVNIGAIAGGVIGGLAFLGVICLLFWLFRKRRRTRDSLLTPLNTHFDTPAGGEKYEIDGDSLGPTPRGERWMAQGEGICSRIKRNLADLEVSLATKFRVSNGAPSVNMNRGNSQFLEPISQHSRSTSAVSGRQHSVLSTKNRLGDWWDRFIEDINFNWRLRNKEKESTSAFVATGSTAEDEISSSRIGHDFSDYLAKSENGLVQAPNGHRRSRSTTTLANVGKLGLSFNNGHDLFENRFSIQPTIPDLSKPPATLTLNPFTDPKDQILPLNKSNSTDYVSNVRRSRGFSQSIPITATSAHKIPPSSAMNPPGGSRYPSTIRTSQSSYRDTMSSPVFISGRQVKGRSDPFDLERPELWLPPPVPSQDQAGARRPSTTSTKNTSNASPGTQGPQRPRVASVSTGKPRVISHADTYTSSKYSSGVSAMLSEWGDPGPDLGAINWRSVSPVGGSIPSNEATTGSLSPRTMESVGRAL